MCIRDREDSDNLKKAVEDWKGSSDGMSVVGKKYGVTLTKKTIIEVGNLSESEYQAIADGKPKGKKKGGGNDQLGKFN